MSFRLAKSVVINTTAGTVTIDGELIPWYIAEDGTAVTEISANGTCVVNLPILAEAVAVER